MGPGRQGRERMLGLSSRTSQQLLRLLILSLSVPGETLHIFENDEATGLTGREVWFCIALIRFFDRGASVDRSGANPALVILHFWAGRVHFQQSEQQGRHAKVGDGVARSQALFDCLEKSLTFFFAEGSPERP